MKSVLLYKLIFFVVCDFIRCSDDLVLLFYNEHTSQVCSHGDCRAVFQVRQHTSRAFSAKGGAEVLKFYIEGSLTITTTGIKWVYLWECEKSLKHWSRIGLSSTLARRRRDRFAHVQKFRRTTGIISRVVSISAGTGTTARGLCHTACSRDERSWG